MVNLWKGFENGDWDNILDAEWISLDTKQAYKHCDKFIKYYSCLDDLMLKIDYCKHCIEADDGWESGVAYPEWIDWEQIKRKIKEDLEGGK